MSKTNTEKMAPETQTPEMANGMKLDVRVRPIAPMGNWIYVNIVDTKTQIFMQFFLKHLQAVEE